MNCATGPAAPLAHSPVLGTYPPCPIPTSLPPSRPIPSRTTHAHLARSPHFFAPPDYPCI
ncbi:hypothetical protein BOTBODRAFT_32058 [Botryobasidium botryosum FD-172 SS1]|uniref:Uncharacterized protein n=1 Tax=Botryobasidium botryosum (strain FD-172 SS1) TaxID=930990 RepID=A0A067MHP6_BOTB1|nr:hypothetical protein BOTBODRAFT_32058 [Botryobasidium botryosum FD-172 SS1]